MSMPCEKCSEESTSVIDSRISNTGLLKRRRECKNCNHRFTTFEATENIMHKFMDAVDQVELLRGLLQGRSNNKNKLKKFNTRLLAAAGHKQ